MRSLFLFPFLLILGVACNQKVAKTSSGSINSQAPFIWEGGNFPKDVKISSAYVTPDDTDKIQAMATAWDAAMNNQVNFFNFTGSDTEKTSTITSSNQLRDNVLGIYKATDWPYPDYRDALAITQIFAIRHNVGDADEYVAIQEADIIMNYQWFKFDDPDPNVWDYDFQTVLLHEMGHFIGLSHKPDTYPRAKSVMYPSIYSWERKQAPLTVDKQDLAEKYGITLPLMAGGSSIVSKPKVYKKRDAGEPVRMILELKANGECLHHMDGVTVGRHHVKF